MSVLQTADILLSRQPESLPRPVAGVAIVMALLSWTLGEMLMASALREYTLLFFGFYVSSAFLLVFWFFRISRMLDTPWTSWLDGLEVAAWAVAPAHLALPAGLIAHSFGISGMVGYEVVKAILILIMLQRTSDGLKQLNQWPSWAGFLLMISPVLICTIVLFLTMMVAVLAFLAGLWGGLS